VPTDGSFRVSFTVFDYGGLSTSKNITLLVDTAAPEKPYMSISSPWTRSGVKYAGRTVVKFDHSEVDATSGIQGGAWGWSSAPSNFHITRKDAPSRTATWMSTLMS
jgi:hypothetical protein